MEYEKARVEAWREWDTGYFKVRLTRAEGDGVRAAYAGPAGVLEWRDYHDRADAPPLLSLSPEQATQLRAALSVAGA